MDRDEYRSPPPQKKIKRVRQIPGTTRLAKIARLQRHVRGAPNDAQAIAQLQAVLR